MNKLRIRAASALFALSVMAGAGAALAQTADAPAVAIAPLSDAEATKFVAANKKVAEVANSMTIELQGAASEEDAAAIQAKAEKRIVAAIQKEGITPTRYTEIIRLAETDAATLAKLRAKFGG
jgi:low affinity Fe/Cu permease